MSHETVDIMPPGFVPKPEWLQSIPDIRSAHDAALNDMWDEEAAEGFRLPLRLRIGNWFRRLKAANEAWKRKRFERRYHLKMLLSELKSCKAKFADPDYPDTRTYLSMDRTEIEIVERSLRAEWRREFGYD